VLYGFAAIMSANVSAWPCAINIVDLAKVDELYRAVGVRWTGVADLPRKFGGRCSSSGRVRCRVSSPPRRRRRHVRYRRRTPLPRTSAVVAFVDAARRSSVVARTRLWSVSSVAVRRASPCVGGGSTVCRRLSACVAGRGDILLGTALSCLYGNVMITV
jgi:hypothetical protein